MSEYTENFELVLYYTRRAVVKPTEPVYNNIQNDNIDFTSDQLLDLYSELKNKFREDMITYEKVKNDSIVSDYVRISEDITFIEKIKEFEKNDFFIGWEKNTKNLINNTFVKLLK